MQYITNSGETPFRGDPISTFPDKLKSWNKDVFDNLEDQMKSFQDISNCKDQIKSLYSHLGIDGPH